MRKLANGNIQESSEARRDTEDSHARHLSQVRSKCDKSVLNLNWSP